jgi:hypothetical protein
MDPIAPAAVVSDGSPVGAGASGAAPDASRQGIVHEPGNPNTRYVTEFYELLTEARKVRGALDLLGEKGAADELVANEPLAAKVRQLEHAAGNLAKINREMHVVRESRDLGPEEKCRRLDKLARQKKVLGSAAVADAK